MITISTTITPISHAVGFVIFIIKLAKWVVRLRV
jgi:hypothetical protein